MTALRILLLTAVLSVVLGYMIVDRTSILNSRDVVTLKVKPVDPQDMFRGDYVILNYDISRLETAALAGDDNFSEGGLVYVTVTNQGGVWTPVAVNRAMPNHDQGAVVLRGTVKSASGASATAPPELTVVYGIESFFVPQGQGKKIEDARQKGDLDADIAVDAQGRGAVKALRRDGGETLYVEGLF